MVKPDKKGRRIRPIEAKPWESEGLRLREDESKFYYWFISDAENQGNAAPRTTLKLYRIVGNDKHTKLSLEIIKKKKIAKLSEKKMTVRRRS